ncbi:Imm49 family immunity protein [Streptomyces sp. NPDC006704]|uniref:Imm49 family immunity protein n=1 Tax=Streptomyces sp. NPDC006704 TaxID=3364760 RepID=UPI0036787C46
MDGLYLAVLAQASDHNADIFTMGAVPWRGHEGRADVALVHALMAYVFAHEEGTGGAPTPGPVREVEKCALIDMVVATLGEGDDLPGHRAALATLRALAVGDENSFVRCLAAQLEQHRSRALSGTGGVPDATGDLGVTEAPGVTEGTGVAGDMGAAGGSAAPRGLLPLDAMALMALAHRRQGWGVGVESGYLPRAVVTGFAPARPRVGAYGRDKRADAVAALTEGPLEVERPPHPLAARATDLAWYDVCAAREMARFHDPDEDPKALTRDLTSLMSDQRRRFLAWATFDPDEPNKPGQWESRWKEDAIREALLLGAEAGAGALRVARAEPGTEVEVSVGGTTRTLPAWRGSYRPHPHQWQQATALALVVGARGPLADCVLIEPEFFDEGERPSPGGAYCVALHDYLRGVDPEPATDRAVASLDRAAGAAFLPPPILLLSQLVQGDRQGFVLALADALEEHREHYAVGKRGEDPEAAVNLDVLGLACHAHRIGWSIPLRSAYLPGGLFR